MALSQKNFSYIRLAMGLFVSLIGVCVLTGWVTGIEILRTILPKMTVMNPLTAVCFILSAFCLWQAQASKEAVVISPWARLVALFIAFVGFSKVISFLGGWEFPIDQILFQEQLIELAKTRPNWIAPNTAVNFALLGTAFILLQSPRGRWFSYLLTLIIIVSSGMTVLGYVTGMKTLYGISSFTPMALSTAVCFLAASVGILTSFSPQLLIRSVGEKRRKKFLYLGFGFALLMILVVNVLVFQSTGSLFETIHWKNHTYEVMEAIKGAREDIILNRRLEDKLSQIEFLTADNPNQLAHIREMRELLEGSAGLNANATESALKLSDKMQKEEHRLLSLRDQQESLHRNRTLLTIYLGTFTSAGLLIGIFSLLYSEIKERQRIESVLYKSEETSRIILSTSPVGIVVADAEGNFTHWNPAAVDIIGIGMTEAPPDQWAETYGAFKEDKKTLLPDSENPLGCAIRGKAVSNAILFIRNAKKPNGVFINSSAQPLYDSQNNLIGGVIVFFDVTEMRRVDRMKSEFISTVSHELRTPLTAIRGSLGLIGSGKMGDISEQIQKLVGIAINNCERLMRLINDILDIEKIESGKIELAIRPVELVPLLEQAITLNLAYGEQFKVTFALKERLPDAWVRADSDKILQVMTNLLSNAAKFSPPGDSVEIKVTREAAELKVSISDHGTGIPDEFKKRIFSKFAQADSSDSRQKNGTGLGLSIVRALIESMGGRVGFDSEIGKGTTFYFTLPESNEKASG